MNSKRSKSTATRVSRGKSAAGKSKERSKVPAGVLEGASFFAILSDVHGNIDALEAVMEDMAGFPVSGAFCLGDVVGYGPEAAACVSKIMDSCVATVVGNHEVMLWMLEMLGEEMDEKVCAPLKLAEKTLTADQLQWLKSLPISADLDPITLCHSSLHEPAAFNYVDCEEEAEANFAAQVTEISFHGHTHVPVVWEEGEGGAVRCLKPSELSVQLDEAKRYAVNVGSVGQPRDGDPRACYVLYDYQKRILLHRRVPYDIPKAQARFKNLPAFLAKRLAVGE